MAQSSINLDKLSVEDLNQLIQEAEAKRAAKQESAKIALINELSAKAAQLGLKLDDLVDKQTAPRTNVRRPRADTGKSIAVKFRGPNDAIWTGRGRMPRWLTEAIERGKNKEDFAV